MNIKTTALYVISVLVTSLNISAEPRPDVYPVVNSPNKPLRVEVVKAIPNETEYFMYTTECKIPSGEVEATCKFPQLTFPGDTNTIVIDTMHTITNIPLQNTNTTELIDETSSETLTMMIELNAHYRGGIGKMKQVLKPIRFRNTGHGSGSSNPRMRNGDDPSNPPKITCLINAPIDTIATCLTTIIGNYMKVKIPVE